MTYNWVALLPRQIIKLAAREKRPAAGYHRPWPGPPFLPVLRAKPPELLRWTEQFTDRRAAAVKMDYHPVLCLSKKHDKLHVTDWLQRVCLGVMPVQPLAGDYALVL
jgi:hypothetical protein